MSNVLTGDIPRLNAEKYPNGFAVLREDRESRTWCELNDNINRLAHALIALGIGKGDRVSLLARNRIPCIEAFFACAKIGAIYSPINYRFAPAEVAYVLGDNGCRVLLCDTEYADLFRSLQQRSATGTVEHVMGFGEGHGFELDYDAQLVGEATDEPPDHGVDEDDVCWICYTGGTTGMFKGVMLTHRNNFIQCVHLGITDRIRHEDVYLVTGALFHVVLNMGLAYLFVGAPIVITDFTPATCLYLIEHHGVTKTVPVATMLNMLLEEQRTRPRDLSSLVLCGTGGAPINPEVVRRAAKEWNCDFVQYFGQTEAAHHFTYLSDTDYRLGLAPEATEKQRRRLESGGRAQHCDRIRIVDDEGNVLPVGEIGEICAQGPNVMRGYWQRPELTAETLHDGWLHTGDVGYLDENGYVYVVDRKKDMIVSGGENIYSSEVAAALYPHEYVVECAVIGIPDDTWGEAVHAFVVPSASAPATDILTGTLLKFARDRLAAYKVPKSIDVVSELPKSPTGKIQKAALRDQFWPARQRRIAASSVGGG